MNLKHTLFVGAFLLGCGGDPDSDHEKVIPLDEVLGSDEARAGVIQTGAELIGGISAEGRLGDVKIYNDRVRFVIQGTREGDFYLPQGGSLVYADIVRPEGQPGRDAVDEWHGMPGLGRVMDPTSVEVVSAGLRGGDAVVRVVGIESPIDFLNGALEAESVVPDLTMEMETEYRLSPGSWLLEVTTTVRPVARDAAFAPGDMLLASDDAGEAWTPGLGVGAGMGALRSWTGWTSDRDDVALAMFPDTATLGNDGHFALLEDLLESATLFRDTVSLDLGESAGWTRWYGVGPDLATLSGAWLEAIGEASQVVAGEVTAPDGSVAGARVIVWVDDEPYTVAVTSTDGSFEAAVPMGEVRTTVDARGDGWTYDHPEGSAQWSSYGTREGGDASLVAYAQGAAVVPSAEGRGYSETLEVSEAATLDVRVDDDLPFEVRVQFLEDDPSTDGRWVRPRASGVAGVGWSRDGQMTMAVEGGTYQVVVHRGQRFERQVETVTVEAGKTTQMNAILDEAFDHAGWILGDPHVHAAPSPDGHVGMADRLLTMAGTGVQVHFGTDHDGVADYRPLLEPLGLSDVLASVVATEVSPVLRGHTNVYPLQPTEGPSGGAWLWYRTLVPDTATHYANIQENFGPDAFIQVNHPVGTGLADFANWSEGYIGKPDFWSDDFTIMEVNNGGSWERNYAFFADVVNRGKKVVPVGVSDAHGPVSGGLGVNATWFGVGTDEVTAYSEDRLREAIQAGRTIVSRGVFLTLSVEPGQTVMGHELVLDVQAHSASWAGVDRLVLHRNGQAFETVEGTEARWVIEQDEDAWFVVMAEGDSTMSPTYGGLTPWAMSAPIYLDVAGDGWDAPLGPMTFAD
jgi:hypothetical protein